MLQGSGRSRTRSYSSAGRRQGSLGTGHPLLEPQDVQVVLWTTTTFHRIASHCIALRRIASHCIALHRIALHCIALHYIEEYYATSQKKFGDLHLVASLCPKRVIGLSEACLITTSMLFNKDI